MASRSPSFSPHRKTFTVFNMVCSSLLALVVVIAINYLSARHPIRQKWLENDRFELSPLTLGILNSLTNEILVTVYFNKENTTALHSSIDGLLSEYDFHSKNIRVKQVDYLRDRKAALDVEQAFKLTDRSPSDLVIFSTPDRFRIVTHQELRDYQTTAAADALMQGQREIKRVGFKGELLFTSAILNIASGEPLHVAYLTGHGEHDLTSKGRDGYASFAEVLKEKNFQLIPHHLIQDGPFPDEVAMLIIAGPQRVFAQEELTEIRRFLERGGRLMLLFNYYGVASATGLENLVKDWGVNVGMNVVDDVQRLRGTELAIGDFRDHPVSTPLVDAQVGLMMYLPRSIDPLPQKALVQTSEIVTQGIAFTSTNGVTKSDLQSGRLQFSHYRDRKGAIPVLTAVEAEASPSVNAPISGRTRLLVAGDSFFLSNSRLSQYGNRDFASLAAAWLLDQDQLLQGIGPKPVYEFKLTIPDPEFRRLQLIMLGVLPGIVFAIGMVVWWRRRV